MFLIVEAVGAQDNSSHRARLIGTMRNAFLLRLFVVLSCAASAQQRPAENTSRWLWVKDYATQIGIAGAEVDIGPGDKCWGQVAADAVKWTAHYTTDAAGRVLIHGLPLRFSCRVTVHGNALFARGGGFELYHPKVLPVWARLRNLTGVIYVGSQAENNGTWSENYWETTDDPTLFRSYIQDPDTAELIPDVKVTALPSGITTTSDANGLFTLEIPARYRKGEFPSKATQTLVFSKPGYKTFEYRQLVLNPGVVPLEVFLSKSRGTLVRVNESIRNSGNPWEDEFAAYAGKAPERPPAGRGEIISFEITPPITYDGTWITCDEGTSAVLKARNLTQATISWTPTGTQMAGHDVSQSMKKVSTSPDGDTWEAELSQVMSTNFVVSGSGKDGKSVRTMDIGNVGCQ